MIFAGAEFRALTLKIGKGNGYKKEQGATESKTDFEIVEQIGAESSFCMNGVSDCGI